MLYLDNFDLTLLLPLWHIVNFGSVGVFTWNKQTSNRQTSNEQISGKKARKVGNYILVTYNLITTCPLWHDIASPIAGVARLFSSRAMFHMQISRRAAKKDWRAAVWPCLPYSIPHSTFFILFSCCKKVSKLVLNCFEVCLFEVNHRSVNFCLNQQLRSFCQSTLSSLHNDMWTLIDVENCFYLWALWCHLWKKIDPFIIKLFYFLWSQLHCSTTDQLDP